MFSAVPIEQIDLEPLTPIYLYLLYILEPLTPICIHILKALILNLEIVTDNTNLVK